MGAGAPVSATYAITFIDVGAIDSGAFESGLTYALKTSRLIVAFCVGVAVVGIGRAFVYIHTIPARKSEPEHFHFDVRFAFCAQNLEFEAGSDATEGKWVPLGAISTIESDESVMRAVKKLL